MASTYLQKILRIKKTERKKWMDGRMNLVTELLIELLIEAKKFKKKKVLNISDSTLLIIFPALFSLNNILFHLG